MSIGLVLAEIIALVFVIVDLQSTAKLVLGVLVSYHITAALTIHSITFKLQEIIFSGLVILVLLATGIACASYAAAWGQPPDACEPSLDEGDDLCDSVPLTAVTALATVSCVCVCICAYDTTHAGTACLLCNCCFGYSE